MMITLLPRNSPLLQAGQLLNELHLGQYGTRNLLTPLPGQQNQGQPPAPLQIQQFYTQLQTIQNQATQLSLQLQVLAKQLLIDQIPFLNLVTLFGDQQNQVQQILLQIQSQQNQSLQLSTSIQNLQTSAHHLLKRLQAGEIYAQQLLAQIDVQLLQANLQVQQNQDQPYTQSLQNKPFLSMIAKLLCELQDVFTKLNSPSSRLPQDQIQLIQRRIIGIRDHAEEIQLQLNHEKEWNRALKGEFEATTYFSRVLDFVNNERSQYPEDIYPLTEEVFTWMRYCAVKPQTGMASYINGITDIKVVILGQDPYPTRGYAHGLAFSCKKDIPKSLNRIFEALERDKKAGFERPDHGNLTRWAKQGVLLLNTILTVRTTKEKKNPVSSVSEDDDCSTVDCNCDSEFTDPSTSQNQTNVKPKSHSNCLLKQYTKARSEWGGVGWETFTSAAIQYVSDNSEGVVFMLWGGDAKRKKKFINKNRHHHVLETCHPAARLKKHYEKFLDCKHFSTANKLLSKSDDGSLPINWSDL